MSRKNYYFIDVLKGIGILFVLLGHTRRPEMVLKMIQAFHMPLFFIISGYLYNYEKYIGMRDKDYIKRRFKSYIYPYVILAFINYLIYGIVICYIELGGSEQYFRRLVRYFIGLVYSRGTWYWMPKCSPIWFLTALFSSSILLYYIMRLSKKWQWISVIICVLFSFGLDILGCMKLPWNIDSALLGVGYMYIGYNIKKYNVLEKVKLIHCIYLLPLGLWAAYNNNVEFVSMDSAVYGNVFLMLIGSIGISISIFILVYRLLPRNRALEYLGRNTIPIIGFNYLVNYFIDIMNSYFNICKQVDWKMQFVLSVIIIIPITICWRYVEEKINYT